MKAIASKLRTNADPDQIDTLLCTIGGCVKHLRTIVLDSFEWLDEAASPNADDADRRLARQRGIELFIEALRELRTLERAHEDLGSEVVGLEDPPDDAHDELEAFAPTGTR